MAIKDTRTVSGARCLIDRRLKTESSHHSVQLWLQEHRSWLAPAGLGAMPLCSALKIKR